jgi:hypothetical protein
VVTKKEYITEVKAAVLLADVHHLDFDRAEQVAYWDLYGAVEDFEKVCSQRIPENKNVFNRRDK